MKIISLLIGLTVFSASAQDPNSYLQNFDSKVYSLKTKGVKDFIVDIVNPKLTKQLNDQLIFGKLSEVSFRVYWTATPERLAMEVHGLPEGFKEVKEELKQTMLPVIENLLPPTTTQKFPGYKFSNGPTPKEIVAQDSSGLAPIPKFHLKFDAEDKLVEVIGKKPIGELTATPQYEKTKFSDNKWVLKSLTTVTSEQGQKLTVKRSLGYETQQGIGVLTEVEIESEQVGTGRPTSKQTETFQLKDYKLNTGDAFKYFLSESKPASP